MNQAIPNRQSIMFISGGDHHQRYLNSSRLCVALEELREQARRQGSILVYCDCGDSNQGASNLEQWSLDVELRRLLGPLLSTIGNHETYLPLEVFMDALISMHSDDKPVPRYIVSNLTTDAKQIYWPLIDEGLVLTESFIHEEQGVRIGFIGIGPETSKTSSLQKHGFTLGEDETFQVIEELSRKLKSQSVDFLIVLSHRGGDWDRKLAQSELSKDIDLIIGGHDHVSCSGLVEGETIFTHAGQSQTVITNAGAFAEYFSRLCFSRSESNQLKALEHELVPTETYLPSAEFVELVKKYKGQSYFRPYTRLVNVSQSDNSIESMLRAVAKSLQIHNCVQIGIARRKELRLEARDTLPMELSKYRLDSMLPYDNKVIICECTGDTLLSILKESNTFAVKYNTGPGLLFSGLRENGGLIEIETEPMIWQNLKPKKKYTIAFSDYSSKEFPSLQRSTVQVIKETNQSVREQLDAYLSG